MASPRLITKPHYGMNALLIGGSLMCFYFAYIVFNGYSADELGTNWIRWLIGGGFAVFALTCLCYGLKTGRVYKDKNEVIFYNLFGFTSRRVKPLNIKRFIELEKESQYARSLELRLYFDEGSFKIWSSSYADYFALRAVLTKKAKNDRRLRKQFERREARNLALIFMGVGLSLIGISAYQYLNADGFVSTAELTTVSGTIHDLDVDLDNNNERAKLTVYLQEYPALSFTFQQYGLSKDRVAHAALNLRRNAQLTISVLTKEYRQKIKKATSPSFFQWPGSRNKVSVYAANGQKYRYLLLPDYNHSVSNRSYDWILVLIGLIFLGTSTFLYPRR